MECSFQRFTLTVATPCRLNHPLIVSLWNHTRGEVTVRVKMQIALQLHFVARLVILNERID